MINVHALVALRSTYKKTKETNEESPAEILRDPLVAIIIIEIQKKQKIVIMHKLKFQLSTIHLSLFNIRYSLFTFI